MAPKKIMDASSSSSSSVNLPDEIIVQILSRLPVKSLFRFKCVSKECHSIISDTNFKLVTQQDAHRLTLIVSDYEGIDSEGILKYYSISDEEALLCVDKLDEYQTPIVCWEEEVMEIEEEHPMITRVLGSCNGLVLLSFNEHIFLWNPFIRCCRKVLELNHLDEKYYSVVASGIFYDSSVDDYKVMVVLQGSIGYLVRFALLKEKTWQHVQCSYPIDDDRIFRFGYQFFGCPLVNDHIHWIIDVSGNRNQIVYFDFNSNKIEILPLPHDNEYCVRVAGLGLFDGCVCLFRLCSGVYDDDEFLARFLYYEVLVMKEYGDKDSWTHMFNVPLPRVKLRSVVCFTRGCGQEACLISTDAGSIFVYDVEKQVYTMVHECEQVHIVSRNFPRGRGGPDILITRSICVESLVSPTQYEWDESSEDEDVETSDDILCVSGGNGSDAGDDD